MGIAANIVAVIILLAAFRFVWSWGYITGSEDMWIVMLKHSDNLKEYCELDLKNKSYDLQHSKIRIEGKRLRNGK